VETKLEDVYISSGNKFGNFYQKLNRIFTQSGVTIVPSAKDSEFRLAVGRERNSKRAISTTKTISVAEYGLRLEVEITLTTASGETIIPPSAIFTERSYTFDTISLVGSNTEEELLLEEMRADLATQILRRVSASVESFESLSQ